MVAVRNISEVRSVGSFSFENEILSECRLRSVWPAQVVWGFLRYAAQLSAEAIRCKVLVPASDETERIQVRQMVTIVTSVRAQSLAHRLFS